MKNEDIELQMIAQLLRMSRRPTVLIFIGGGLQTVFLYFHDRINMDAIVSKSDRYVSSSTAIEAKAGQPEYRKETCRHTTRRPLLQVWRKDMHHRRL